MLPLLFSSEGKTRPTTAWEAVKILFITTNHLHRSLFSIDNPSTIIKALELIYRIERNDITWHKSSVMVSETIGSVELHDYLDTHAFK